MWVIGFKVCNRMCVGYMLIYTRDLNIHTCWHLVGGRWSWSQGFTNITGACTYRCNRQKLCDPDSKAVWWGCCLGCLHSIWVWVPSFLYLSPGTQQGIIPEPGFLLPLCKTGSFPCPGFGLAQLGCCRHLRNEPADRSLPVSVSFCFSLSSKCMK